MSGEFILINPPIVPDICNVAIRFNDTMPLVSTVVQVYSHECTDRVFTLY